MAPTIASPVARPYAADLHTPKGVTGLQVNEQGRSTPLPQYERTQSVPFNLTLQEDKRNPGQFQLVVDIDPERHRGQAGQTQPAASKKLFTNLQAFPSLGYDVSSLYQTQKSSPPMSPLKETQEWSDLDAIPPDFLKKVVPDWELTFQRKDSTASTQSRRLADIKARIKKNGKGFVVRLLKGSSSDTNEVAEVHLGQPTQEPVATVHELDSCPQIELDATEAVRAIPQAIEIGSSGETGLQRPSAPLSSSSSVPEWLRTTTFDVRPRNSIAEESFSDAETLAQETQPFGSSLEDDQTVVGTASDFPTRTASISSIVKTPTRGLSVVGPVKRIGRHEPKRLGRRQPSYLSRSDAKKSWRASPDSSSSPLSLTRERIPTSLNSVQQVEAIENPDLLHEGSETPKQSPRNNSTTRLRVRTDVPRAKSANSSPVTKRKKSPRHHKTASSSSSLEVPAAPEDTPSPVWSEVSGSGELREALELAFGTVSSELGQPIPDNAQSSIPRIEEPSAEDQVGEIPILPGIEIRSPPPPPVSPMSTFWGLAVSALSDRLFEGLHAMRLRYGSEPPVPPNHLRTCGELLYDDFIERRPGAARALELYLNRPRSHSPVTSSGRTSTSSTVSSLFSSASRASTLATPISTYGGASWSKSGDSSRLSPTRLRSNNPFSVRIGNLVDEQWLLTCANEGRFTPKIVHLDVNPVRIRSDKDLALALREHYDQLNRRWTKWARLRGLTTIEFVQFEVHRNRFADIRASPSMPPRSSSSSPKSPSEHPYAFEPIDLMPPVGSAYLLHLFKHPNDYDGELITYLRSPKRRERLEFGMGWGINLVEGFLAQKVWLLLTVVFGIGSAIFAVLYSIGRGDVQGAFGVAGWFVTLAGLLMGGLQAWLE
ncbi:hypothetical protein BU24DRAFT_414141 [Aaosphaeria arxii CBS 175.79]|uniref:Uncharacterized protein n=1 Tax=Aaosphaeria arxii CBS 175.79 TaxID=1450172 RepID=A0A6A5XC77_9PLEO|nr:uncharacterized protein BU24DRAFT_414141 [Aaosphaeria arxii CBS 175.79]KAF2010568.1 hypothetical protein BU24DRAFT_414141 [Aaosphaeria arxii CBS 175.79]